MANYIRYSIFEPQAGVINTFNENTTLNKRFDSTNGDVAAEWTKITTIDGKTTAGSVVAAAILYADSGAHIDSYSIDPNYNFARQMSLSTVNSTVNPITGLVTVGAGPALVAIGDNSPGDNFIELNNERFDPVAYPDLATLFNPKDDTVAAMCYVPFLGKFILVGLSGKTYFYNGTTFTGNDASSLPSNFSGSYLVAASSTKLVVCNGTSTGYSSTNGISWTPFTITGLSNSVNFITSLNEKFFFADSNAMLFVINDNLTNASYDTGAGSVNGIAFHGTKYIIAASAPNGIWVADQSDLSVWTQVTFGDGEGTTQSLNCIINTGTLFIAGGNGGDIITATDPSGVWTLRTSNSGSSIDSLTFKPSGNIVAGCDSDIVSSPDGITWTNRATGANVSIAIVYGVTPDIFFGIENVMKSATGITWALVTFAPQYYQLPNNPWVGHTNSWIAAS